MDMSSAPAVAHAVDGASKIRVWVPRLAFVVAGVLLLIVVADYALTPLYTVFAPDNLDAFAAVSVGLLTVAWWVLLAASLALAVVLAWSWPGMPAAAHRWLLLVGAGLVLYWGWSVVTASVDVWGMGGFVDVTPELTLRATLAAVVGTVVALIAACLLVVGGLRLRAAARTA